MKKTACFLLLLSFLFSNCKPKQEIVKKKSPRPKTLQELLTNIKESELHYEYLSLKASTDVSYDNKNHSFKTVIRMQKDSVIWLSITPLVGIEAIRALITRDSVKIINRLENTYFVGGLEYLNNKFDTELDLELVQALLLGNSIRLDDDDGEPHYSLDHRNYFISSFKRRKLKRAIEKREKLENKTEKLERKGEKFDFIVHSLWIEPAQFKIIRQTVNDLKEDNSINANYSDFKLPEQNVGDTVQQLFPHVIQFEIDGKKSMSVNLNITKIDLEGSNKFPFKIPEKYEQIH